MRKLHSTLKIQFILSICLLKSGSICAQWSEKDSVWLQNVLSGKEEIRLNPEALKAIESGTLISTDMVPMGEQMIDKPNILPISKDFTEYIAPEKKEGLPDPFSLPPAVFMLYGLDLPLPKIYRSFMVPDEIKRNGTKPSGVSFDDALKSIFSPRERIKAKNRKAANAWKRYNAF